eukprot:TRINITY_DN30904_c0_g1_i1.p1 TRINITY_DN30904_c0_g1~~TRINITY_DN30904_c0_g1_i1.p1  ORF type:complete len:358 (+),score=98.51 TRINITY_DN30904_c0_g1_i1:60-1076(+)
MPGEELLVYVRLPCRDELVPVEVSADATVAALQRAVWRAGGPAPALQRLSVGGERLDAAAPLADARVCMEAVVDVGRPGGGVSLGFTHAVVLRDGKVQTVHPAISPVLFENATAVAAGKAVSVAVLADGSVKAFGERSDRYQVAELGGAVACVCGAGCAQAVAVVHADGRVTVDGPDAEVFAAARRLPSSVAAMALAEYRGAAVMADGTVLEFRDGDGGDEIDTGGRKAIHCAAGRQHTAVLLEGGAVHCCGDNTHGQCSVPVDLPPVTALAAGTTFTAALTDDGAVNIWGCWEGYRLTGTYLAIAANGHEFAALSASGELVTMSDAGMRASLRLGHL